MLICKRVYRAKLRTIPPLPNWVKELGTLNEVGAVLVGLGVFTAVCLSVRGMDECQGASPWHAIIQNRCGLHAASSCQPPRPALTPRSPLLSTPPTPQTLANERGKLAQHEQIELLIDSLGDESMTVRATALRELRTLLSTRREWALGLLGPGSGTTAGDRATRRPAAVDRPAGRGGTTGSGAGTGGSATEGPQLLSRLMAALLRCCDPEVHNMVSQQAQQACAECLGMLGAVDPARLQVDPQPPASRCT